MKSLPVFLAVVAFLLWARATRTPWLFFGWAFLVTGFPLLRGLVGPIPVYLFDVAVGLVWTVVLLRPDVRAWPSDAPPWMALFLAVLTVFGTVLPMLGYGFYPEMVWNLGHTGLAMTTIVLGAFLLRGASAEERAGFRNGLVAGLAVLTVIAVLQKASADWNSYFVALFYGGGEDGAESGESVLIAETLSAMGRVSGPFGSPNTFGIVALMAAMNHWLLSTLDDKKGLVGTVVLGALVVVAVACGSRQVILAGGLIVLGYALNRSPSKTLPGLALSLGVIALVLMVVDADAFVERLSRLGEGADESNVSARLSEGPQRFWEMLSWDPVLALTGVGLEIQKLSRYGVVLPSQILDGFVSNGYLLYDYFFGVVGFVIMSGFWAWVGYRGVIAPKAVRFITAGGGLALAFIVFADNHAVLAEELLNQIMVFVGLLTALSGRDRSIAARMTAIAAEGVPRNAHRSSH